jgi:hypothetical protein
MQQEHTAPSNLGATIAVLAFHLDISLPEEPTRTSAAVAMPSLLPVPAERKLVACTQRLLLRALLARGVRDDKTQAILRRLGRSPELHQRFAPSLLAIVTSFLDLQSHVVWTTSVCKRITAALPFGLKTSWPNGAALNLDAFGCSRAPEPVLARLEHVLQPSRLVVSQWTEKQAYLCEAWAPGITHLDISGLLPIDPFTPWQSERAPALSLFYGRMTSLQHLTLRDCVLEAIGLHNPPPESLTAVTLIGCSQGWEYDVPIFKSVERLTIKDVGRGYGRSESTVTWLLMSARTWPSVTYFEGSSQDASALAVMLYSTPTRLPSVRHLKLTLTAGGDEKQQDAEAAKYATAASLASKMSLTTLELVDECKTTWAAAVIESLRWCTPPALERLVVQKPKPCLDSECAQGKTCTACVKLMTSVLSLPKSALATLKELDLRGYRLPNTTASMWRQMSFCVRLNGQVMHRERC